MMQVWHRDNRGESAIQFALVAPAFFLLIIGIVEFGLVLWTQIGLQHGAEMAARCASVNTRVCATTTAIQAYAAGQTLGLNPPPATFAVATPACGNQVSATYVFNFVTQQFGSLTLGAQACYAR